MSHFGVEAESLSRLHAQISFSFSSPSLQNPPFPTISLRLARTSISSDRGSSILLISFSGSTFETRKSRSVARLRVLTIAKVWGRKLQSLAFTAIVISSEILMIYQFQVSI